MNPHPADEMSHRDRDSAERHQRDPSYSAPTSTGTPHHSNAGSLPIHQPVASRLPGAIHSPGGLLASHGSAPPNMPLGAPSGAVNNYGAGPLASDSNRALPHKAQNASSQMFGAIGNGPNAGAPSGSGAAAAAASSLFGGPLQENGRPPAQGAIPFGPGGSAGGGGGGMPASHPGPPGSGAMPQGQQPILNVSC